MEMKEICWWVELAVRPGCLDDFEKLTGEMVTAARAESGVLASQRFIMHDQRTIYVHEQYENSDVAARHLRNFAASFGARYASMVERRRFLVFGDPSAGLRALLDEFGATYHELFGRFPYWNRS